MEVGILLAIAGFGLFSWSIYSIGFQRGRISGFDECADHVKKLSRS